MWYTATVGGRRWRLANFVYFDGHAETLTRKCVVANAQDIWAVADLLPQQMPPRKGQRQRQIASLSSSSLGC